MRRILAAGIAAPLLLAPVALAVAPAQAATLNIPKIEKNIKKTFKEEGYTVKVRCPAKVKAKKGNNFYCKVSNSTGSVRVKVVQKNNKGDVRWKTVK